MTDLYHKLIVYTNGKVDRQGEVHITCPNCGKASSPTDTHCSFSKKGFHCFVCNASFSLQTLAEKVGLNDESTYNPPIPVTRRVPVDTTPSWAGAAWSFVRKFSTGDDKYKWISYKPITMDAVNDYNLGYGILPQSRCTHPRLVVPLICGNEVVGFRGRQVDPACECGKWLSSYGSKPILYNGGQLVNDNKLQKRLLLGKSSRRVVNEKCVLYIVENPIDAILFEEQMINRGHEFYRAVATLGVTIWKDEWTEAIKQSGIKTVIVLYDHDLAGNGASSPDEYKEMVARWQEKNPKVKRPPVPNGIRLANKLLNEGVGAVVYRWRQGTPLKYDIGNLLTDNSVPL